MSPKTYRDKRRRLLYLRKVLKVQEFFQVVHVEGQSLSFVYREHIEHEFHISYVCFTRYLGINARREIRQLDGELEGYAEAAA
jgi:hypothetical protein